jgi:hypothetical protein
MTQKEFLQALRGTTPLDVLDAFEDVATEIQFPHLEDEPVETPFLEESVS